MTHKEKIKAAQELIKEVKDDLERKAANAGDFEPALTKEEAAAYDNLKKAQGLLFLASSYL